MSQRTKSNPSLVSQYDDRISQNVVKLRLMGKRLSSLGETLEDSRRKTSLLSEMLTIIQQTLDLQRKQAELFPQLIQDI